MAVDCSVVVVPVVAGCVGKMKLVGHFRAFSANTDRNKGSILYGCTVKGFVLKGMGTGGGKSKKAMGLYMNK